MLYETLYNNVYVFQKRRISGTAEGKVVSGEMEDDSFSIHFTERNDHAKTLLFEFQKGFSLCGVVLVSKDSKNLYNISAAVE